MPAPDPRAIESLIAFWADAGVDVALADAPIDRTAAAREALAAKPALPRPVPRAVAGPTAPPERFDAALVAGARAAADAAADVGELAATIAAYDGCGLKFQGARQ